MPPVVAFLKAVGSFVTFATATGTTAAVIGAAAIVGGVFAASKLLKPKINFSVDDNDRSRQTTVRSTTEPRKLIYGETMVSGPLTYAQVSGANNKYLHQVVALAGHELTQISKVFLDDKSIDLTNASVYNSGSKSVISGFFGPKNNESGVSETVVYIDTRLGTSSQTAYSGLRADSTTSTEYLATHRGDNVASLYTRWTINEGSREVWDEVGSVQNIKALVKGKKIYDPRLEVDAGGTAGASPTNASYVVYDDNSLSTGAIDRGEQGRNPALMIADYLMDSEFGLGIPSSKIDWAAIIAAADDCDTLVDIPNSATQKRFFGSGVIFGADPYAKSIEKILSGMNGSLVYSQGKYIVRAGVYFAPTESITEDDIIGEVDIRTAIPRSDRLNQIKGLFIDPTEQYKMMEFGPVTVSGAIARDNGETLEEEIKLPFTDNRYAAQRIAFKQVNQSFLQTMITVPVNLKGMRIAVGDRVNVYLSDLESVDAGEWNPKIFKCINWSFAENGSGGINLTLLEEGEFSNGVAIRYADPLPADYSTITAQGVIARNLPDVPAPTNFGITAAINAIELAWDNPSNALAWEQIWVFRNTTGTTPTDSDTPIVKFRGTSYTDQRAAADSQGNAIEYYYWIQAVRYPQGSTPASGSNASKSVMIASNPAKIGATKIGFGVMGEDSINTAQIIDSAVGSEQIATTIQSDNWSVQEETGWQINRSGSATFQNAVVRGNVTATTGTIGGFTVGSTDLIAGDEATRVSLSTSDGISLGDNTFADAPFRVTPAGELTATDATITGSITASTGTIGGFTVGSTSLTAGDEATRVSLSTSDGISLGDNTFADAPFRVTRAGALTATNATITGAITATSLEIAEGATIEASSAFTRTPFVSFTSIGQTAFSPAVNGSLVTWTQVNGTYSWNHKLVSDKAFKNGAFVSFRVKSAGDTNIRYMIGLADANTGTSYTDIDYAIYIRGSASTPDILAYESGSNVATLKSTLNVGDVCAVVYDDEKIKYIINGVVERTVDLSSSPITDGLYTHIAIDDDANNGTHTIEDFQFGSISDLALGVTIQDGGITMAGGGSIKGGQSGYNTGTGFFLGYDSTAYKFSIGNSSTESLTFDGTNLAVTGNITATSGTFTGTVNASAGAFTGDVSTDSKFIAGSGDATTVVDGATDATYRIFSGAAESESENAPFQVKPDGSVFAKNITVFDASGNILLNQDGLGAAALAGISLTSGTAVDKVSGVLSGDGGEMTLTLDQTATVTLETKFAIYDNSVGTLYFYGSGATEAAAKSDITNSTLNIIYSLQTDGGSYSTAATKPITFTSTDSTPSSTEIYVTAVYIAGGIQEYRSILMDAGGALEYIANTNTYGATAYVVTSHTFTNLPAGVHKVKLSSTITGSGSPSAAGQSTSNRLYELRSSEINFVESAANVFANGTPSVPTGGGTVSGNLVVTGDLTVQGTTTTVDTDNLTVKDNNITLNYSTGDSTSTANNAGITIQDAVDTTTDASILWKTASDSFLFSHKIRSPQVEIDGETLTSSDDLDSLNDGFYKWASSQPTNAPTSYMVMYQMTDPNQKIQIAWGSSSSGKLYIRRADGGTFYAWTQMLTTASASSTYLPLAGGTLTGAAVFADQVQIGDTVQQNSYGLLQVNQEANNDESGIGILDSTGGRSMRLWTDDTNSYINSGDGGSGLLYLNEDVRVTSDGNFERIGSHLSGFQIGGHDSIENNRDKINPIYVIGNNYLPTSDTDASGMYGITMSRSGSVGPSAFSWTANDGWGFGVITNGTGKIWLDGDEGVIEVTSGYNINGTTVIDSSRNLTNIGTISSGAITSSGQVTGNGGVKGDPYLWAVGAESSIGVLVDSKTSFDNTNEMATPAIQFRESDGTNVASVRGIVNTSGNFLSLGVGLYGNQLSIGSSGATFTGAITASEQSVFTGNSISGTPNPSAQLVAADSGVAGIAIQTNDGGSSYVWFGDTTDNAVGRIRYDHSTDGFTFRAGATNDVFEIDSSGMGKFFELTLKGGSDNLTFTETGGDWSIKNAQQDNGIVIYDGTAGVEIHYNNAAVAEFNSAGGMNIVSGQLRMGGATRIGATGAGTFTDVTLFDDSPLLTLSDTGNGGGGGAEGKILFSNNDGNAIGIGYTNDTTADSDLIISTNAGGTYGGYLGLDAAGIADAKADIILEPKTNVRIATGSLEMGTTVVIDASRNIVAGTISSGRHTITSSGTIGGATVANGYSIITDGINTLAFDPNEIHTTSSLFILSEDADIYFRGLSNAGVILRNGTTQFMDASRNLTNIVAITSTGIIKTTENIQSGDGSGGVALTINDGYGNANVTWNHENGTPEQDGNAARIEVNTDSSSGAAMYFELLSNVSSGVAVQTTNVFTLIESAARLENGKTLNIGDYGKIGSVATDRIYIATTDGLGLQLDKDNNRIVPVTEDGVTYNNNVSFGTASLPFKNLFLSANIDVAGRILLNGGAGGTALLDVDDAVSDDWAGRIENSHASGYGVLVITASNSASQKAFEVRKNTSDAAMLITADGLLTVNYAATFNSTISSSAFKISGSTVIDASRNLVNIQSIQGNSETGGTTIFNVGRGDVYFESNSNGSNDSGAGITLRTASNPSGNGSIFDVRSSGQATRLYVGQSLTSSGYNPFYVGNSDSTTDNGVASNYSIELLANGNITAEGNITAYGSASDIRLKDNIETIPDALNKIKSLTGVTFNYKKDGSRSTGVIAQEVQKVLPEVIYEASEVGRSEDGDSFLAVRYGQMMGLAIEAIKDLSKEIDALKTQIKELKDDHNQD